MEKTKERASVNANHEDLPRINAIRALKRMTQAELIKYWCDKEEQLTPRE